MLARYPGSCIYCKKPITVGVDTYDVDTKQNWHEVCHESQPPGPDAFRLADSLGFIGPNEPIPQSWFTWSGHKVNKQSELFGN